MSTFERDLRRDGHAVGKRGGYRVEQFGTCWEVCVPLDRAGAVPTYPAGGWRFRTMEREHAIAWAVRDAGEEVDPG